MQGIDAPEKMQALLSGLKKKEEAKEEVPNSRPVTNIRLDHCSLIRMLYMLPNHHITQTVHKLFKPTETTSHLASMTQCAVFQNLFSSNISNIHFQLNSSRTHCNISTPALLS